MTNQLDPTISSDQTALIAPAIGPSALDVKGTSSNVPLATPVYPTPDGQPIPVTTSSTASTTTISNGNKINQVPGIAATTDKLSQTGVTTDPTSGVSTNANGTIATDPNSETSSTVPSPTIPPSSQGVSQGGYVGDIYYPQGATLPKDTNGNYSTTTATSPADDQIHANLNALIAKSDASTASTIQGIQAQYANLIQQQQRANAYQNAGMTRFALNGGQGVASTTGLQNIQTSYGIQQITDLQNKEQAAIAAAQAAGDNQDYQLMDKLNSEIATIRQQKQDAAAKLNDQIAAQAKTIADQNFQTATAEKAAINGILKDAADNGVTDPKILASIGSATNLSSAIAAAGDNLTKMSGDFADYPQYKKDATASGVVPLSATDWLVKKQASDAKNKANEAYGTAFASAKGKAAGEAAATASGGGLLPVTSDGGITYNVPASVAPYVKIAPNGTKYVDVSGLTPSEKGNLQKAAYNNGVNPIPVVTDPSYSGDISNIADATLKLKDMRSAFDGLNATSAADRNLYQAAAITMAKKLQTDPQAVGTDIYQDAALDILKAMSGTKGFRGGSSMVDAVKSTFPKATDTKAVVDQKIANMQSLMDDRLVGLVGKPPASDQAIIDAKNSENNLTAKLSTVKTTDPKTYTAASLMFTTVDPATGYPYTASDVLASFPTLNN